MGGVKGCGLGWSVCPFWGGGWVRCVTQCVFVPLSVCMYVCACVFLVCAHRCRLMHTHKCQMSQNKNERDCVWFVTQ